MTPRRRWCVPSKVRHSGTCGNPSRRPTSSASSRKSCLRTKRMLLYRIADPGEGFNIEALCHAAVCNPHDDPLRHAIVREEQGLRPGGLGIAITRSLIDELVYNEARNEVVFVKYLD